MPDTSRSRLEPRSATDLLRARLHDRISRRELVQRGLALGLALPTIGVLLHATGRDGSAQDANAKPARAREATAPAGQRRGGILTAGVVGAVDTLNPYLANLNGQSFDVLSGIMEGLLTVDSRQRLRPALAERYEISDDGLVYTFRLRQGVTFHNGDPFTADDVVRTWETIMDERLPAWQRLGWDKIARIDVPDPTTLVVTTTEISASFLAAISAGAGSNGVIAPARALRRGVARFAREFGEAPIGTGPMAFVERRGDDIVLERNRDYWGGKPSVGGVAVRLFPDYEAQLAALRGGELDLIARTGIPGGNLVDEALAIDGVTVLEFPGLTWGHLDLKQVGFLRETTVRQALDHATPAERIIDRVLGGQATRAVADQAPGSWAHNRDLEPRPYSPRRAARLLDEAGITLNRDGVRERDGERFEIELWGEESDPQAPAVLDLIAESWARVGVRATVRFQRAPTLWGPVGYQYSDKMTAGYYRWANGNDPDDLALWHSSQIPTSPGGPGGNIPAFFNEYAFQAEIDDLTARAAAETDRERRKELYGAIQALLREETPVIFLFWDKEYAAASDTVGGFWPSAYNDLLWNAGEWYRTK